MALARASGTRQIQQELFRHGGKRKGAGRKPRGHRAGTSHAKRLEVELKHPQRVTRRVVPEVGNLRRRDMYRAVREATIVAAVLPLVARPPTQAKFTRTGDVWQFSARIRPSCLMFTGGRCRGAPHTCVTAR